MYTCLPQKRIASQPSNFQPIAVKADEIKDYSFSWVVLEAEGTYRVEVEVVPAQLTAYDTVWLKIN